MTFNSNFCLTLSNQNITMIFEQQIIEEISKRLGTYSSGSQITTYLQQVGLIDVDGANSTKWRRLYNTFAEYQNKTQNCAKILEYIELALSPSRFLNQEEMYYSILDEEMNPLLAFVGLELGRDGKFKSRTQVTTIGEAQKRAKTLKQELERRKAHVAIFQYCKAELLENNYFHAVFEAIKGLMERVREISCCSYDGINLIEFVFSKNDPVVIINNWRNQSEQDEHKGFCNLLKGLIGMFRNTEAHEPKVYWPVSEQDALEILSIISYCHRRLDNAQKIR